MRLGRDDAHKLSHRTSRSSTLVVVSVSEFTQSLYGLRKFRLVEDQRARYIYIMLCHANCQRLSSILYRYLGFLVLHYKTTSYL